MDLAGYSNIVASRSDKPVYYCIEVWFLGERL